MNFQSLTTDLMSKFRTLYENAVIAFYEDSKTKKEIRFQYIKNDLELCQALINQFEEEKKGTKHDKE